MRHLFTTLIGNVPWIAFRHVYVGKASENQSMLFPVTASDLVKNWATRWEYGHPPNSVCLSGSLSLSHTHTVTMLRDLEEVRPNHRPFSQMGLRGSLGMRTGRYRGSLGASARRTPFIQSCTCSFSTPASSRGSSSSTVTVNWVCSVNRNRQTTTAVLISRGFQQPGTFRQVEGEAEDDLD